MESLYIRIRGEVVGPLNREAAQAVFRERKLTPSHQISYDGNEWFAASDIWDQLHSIELKAAQEPSSTPGPHPGSSSPAMLTSPPPPEPRARRRSEARARSETRPSSDAPPASEVRQPSVDRPSSEVRKSSVELSADARTPTTEETVIKQVAIGIPQTILSFLLPAVIIAELVAVGFLIHLDVRMQELLGGIVQDELTKLEVNERLQSLTQNVNRTSFAVHCGALAVFTLYCFWIYYTDNVLQRRRLRRLRFTAWGCVGWEFVPLLNWWFPYQVLSEVWRGAASHNKMNWQQARTPLLIIMYWIVDVATALTAPFLVYSAYSIGLEAQAMETQAQVTAYLESLTDYISFEFGRGIAVAVGYSLMLIIVVIISLRLRMPKWYGAPPTTANTPAVVPAAAPVDDE